jgi:hypothetical protein
LAPKGSGRSIKAKTAAKEERNLLKPPSIKSLRL